jgi:TPR repeat protein
MKQIRAVEQARISASDSAGSTREEQIAAMLAGANATTNAPEGTLQQMHRDAANGSVDAQFFLGYMYETGDQVTKDQREAIRWYQKAAAQGSNSAKEKLSKLL